MVEKTSQTGNFITLIIKHMQSSKGFNATWVLLLLLGTLLWQCDKDTYKGETTGLCPEVISTNPENSATNVVTNTLVTATFNKDMEAATINGETFSVKQGLIPVSGMVSYSNKVATFTPTSPLEVNKTYTGTITKRVKDPDGNSPIENYVWIFSTGNAPRVIATDPITSASNVALNKVITATFNTSMNPTTINSATFLINQGTNVISGTVSYAGTTATFTPTNLLADNTVYTGTITIGAKDLLGNALVNNYQWSFSTAQTQYTISLSSSPAIGGSTSGGGLFNRDGETTIHAVPHSGYSFTNWTEGLTMISTNRDLLLTVTTNRTLVANFTINSYILNVTSVHGTVNRVPNQSSFNHGTSVLLTAVPNIGYAFAGWSGDATGTNNPLLVNMNSNKDIAANYTALPSGPAGVNLGSAGDFAVLAGSGISNTGVSTLIIGDVGSYPTATINGLLAGNVNGTLYTSADPMVGLAKVDLTSAFNDAQSRSLNAISLPGQLGGLTLTPGLYVNSTTSGISGTGPNGILTLDAGGNPNAVWIFKMGSTFITDAGTSIVLAGGAQAKNIYWSVGSSATLGTNSIFYGNILADQAITLTTGARLTGRALTRIAAISLDTNSVTKP